VVEAGPLSTEVPGERDEQLDGAVAEVVVVPVVDPLAVDDLRAVDLGELAGDLLVCLPPDAGDLVDHLGSVLRQLVAEVLPDGAGLDRAVGRLNRALGVEVGVEVELDAQGVVVLSVPLAERAGRRPEAAVGVLHDEHLLRAVGVDVEPGHLARAEELPGVLADEQRHVRLLF